MANIFKKETGGDEQVLSSRNAPNFNRTLNSMIDRLEQGASTVTNYEDRTTYENFLKHFRERYDNKKETDFLANLPSRNSLIEDLHKAAQKAYGEEHEFPIKSPADLKDAMYTGIKEKVNNVGKQLVMVGENFPEPHEEPVHKDEALTSIVRAAKGVVAGFNAALNKQNSAYRE